MTQNYTFPMNEVLKIIKSNVRKIIFIKSVDRAKEKKVDTFSPSTIMCHSITIMHWLRNSDSIQKLHVNFVTDAKYSIYVFFAHKLHRHISAQRITLNGITEWNIDLHRHLNLKYKVKTRAIFFFNIGYTNKPVSYTHLQSIHKSKLFT